MSSTIRQPFVGADSSGIESRCDSITANIRPPLGSPYTPVNLYDGDVKFSSALM